MYCAQAAANNLTDSGSGDVGSGDAGSGEIVCPVSDEMPAWGDAIVAVLAVFAAFFFGFSCLLICRERAGNPLFLQLSSATTGIHLEMSGGSQAGRPSA